MTLPSEAELVALCERLRIKRYSVSATKLCMEAADVIEALGGELASMTKDYFRRHKDAVDRMEERTALRAENAALQARIKSYEGWERSINEALNSGDGSYRP